MDNKDKLMSAQGFSATLAKKLKALASTEHVSLQKIAEAKASAYQVFLLIQEVEKDYL